MLYIGLQIRRQGPDVKVLRQDQEQGQRQEQDQGQGSDHTGQRTGTRMQDQDEQQPEQEQVRYSAPEQATGPDSAEQITRPGCRQQTADRWQSRWTGPDTDDRTIAWYIWHSHSNRYRYMQQHLPEHSNQTRQNPKHLNRIQPQLVTRQ